MLIIGALIVGFIVLCIILVVVLEKDRVYGTCPTCNTPIGLMKGIGACEKCGAGLRFVNNQFVPLEPGFVPDYPTFQVPLTKLKHPSKWQVIWEGRCCVCGTPAVRRKQLRIKMVVGQTGPLFTPTNITATEKFAVGYCEAHKDGILYSFPAGWAYAKSNAQCWLAIRSFDYYREFMQHNSN